MDWISWTVLAAIVYVFGAFAFLVLNARDLVGKGHRREAAVAESAGPSLLWFVVGPIMIAWMVFDVLIHSLVPESDQERAERKAVADARLRASEHAAGVCGCESGTLCPVVVTAGSRPVVGIGERWRDRPGSTPAERRFRDDCRCASVYAYAKCEQPCG